MSASASLRISLFLRTVSPVLFSGSGPYEAVADGPADIALPLVAAEYRAVCHPGRPGQRLTSDSAAFVSGNPAKSPR